VVHPQCRNVEPSKENGKEEVMTGYSWDSAGEHSFITTTQQTKNISLLSKETTQKRENLIKM